MHTIRIVFFTFVCAAVLLCRPAGAEAALEGNSRTFFRSWESLDESRHHTIYQYLDVDLEELGKSGFSFHFGGWGRADLADESYGDSSRGEFQYGYLNYLHPKANAVARVGRFYVSEGVALHENLDGFYARGDLLGGLTLSLYGGIPVETDEDGRGSDFMYGGRLSYRGPGSIETGVSFLKENNDGDGFREEAGVDVALGAGRTVSLVGQSTFNTLESEWSDHDYRLALGPYMGWSVTGTLWWVDYDGYFQSPATSAFILQPLEAGETLLFLAGEVEYSVTPRLALSLAYEGYSYDVAESATAYVGRLTWSSAKEAAGIALRHVDGASDALRYSELRGYASKEIGSFDIVVDALSTTYDEKINGEDKAHTIVLGAGYRVHPRLRLGADLEYSSNPFFDREIKAFAKLLWRFSAGTPAKEGEGR